MQTIIVGFRSCLEQYNYRRVMTYANYLHSPTFHLCCLLLTKHTLRVIVWPLTLQAWSALKTAKVFQWWVAGYRKISEVDFMVLESLWSWFHRVDFMVAVSTTMLRQALGVWVYWYCNNCNLNTAIVDTLEIFSAILPLGENLKKISSGFVLDWLMKIWCLFTVHTPIETGFCRKHQTIYNFISY